MRYLCMACRKSASSARRADSRTQALWREYVRGKRTKEQLGENAGRTPRTITKLLDAAELPEKVHRPRPVVLIIDATYFGREYGVLVARDPNARENLYVAELRHETKLEYTVLRHALEVLGYTIQAVVLDGRRGIPRVFEGIPSNMPVPPMEHRAPRAHDETETRITQSATRDRAIDREKHRGRDDSNARRL